MPRNVRNFWIDATIDGRANTLSGGPRSKQDGMRLSILQRERGDISESKIDVSCQVHHGCYIPSEGKEVTELVTFIELPSGTSIRENPDGSYTAILRTRQ